MEQIILSFDISCERLGFSDAADLRREISELLDNALKAKKCGKWAGGSFALDTMQIFIRSDNPDAAISVINETLCDNPLFKSMRIKQQS